MKEMGAAFGSMGAALGTGECLTALVRLSKLTSSFLSGSILGARPVLRIVRTGAEMTRREGFMPLREFPFGNSLLRTALLDCSRAFACALRLGEGRESGTTVSDGLAVLALPA